MSQQGRQIVIGALNTTAFTVGFARCVSKSIVCDSINRPGDLDDDILPAAHGPPGQKGEKVRPANDNDDNNNNTSKNNKLLTSK